MESPITVALAIAMYLYPIPAIVGNILFWGAFRRKDGKKCLYYFLLSASGYLVIIGLIVALELMCDGRFVCH